MSSLFEAIAYIPHIISACGVVVVYFYQSVVLQKPVSYPGDELVEKLSRRGRWPQRKTSISSSWKFYHDSESHEVSLKEHKHGGILVGESAGRQIWYQNESTSEDVEFSFDPSQNPNSGDKILRNSLIKLWIKKNGLVPDSNSAPTSNKEVASKGFAFYQMLQCDDGHWAGDYGGPMFLMPDAMIHYLKNHQQIDGGWGTHIECASTMFGTVLSYVALRLLGVGPHEEFMKLAHAFMMTHGGALYAPSWAKFWLAVIGVYHWDGINSIPAEMWFLPRWFPFHPGKLWCHCRMVYLPMCYLYSKRFTPDVANDPVLLALRKELYIPGTHYESINWDKYRQKCADIDVYSPLNPIMKIAQDFLSYYEFFLPRIPPLAYLRRLGVDFAIKYIYAEDIQTNFIDIGPVNKALNMLSVWVNSGCNKDSQEFKNHLVRVDDYLWVAEDGMKMQGYNGSQCWDTCFTIQALYDAQLVTQFPEASLKVYSYLDRTQIKTDEKDREFYFRQISKGGWPFSTAAHGWPISDCSAEGLKSVLCLHKVKTLDGSPLIPEEKRIPESRLNDCVDVILSLHNADGGWATYENNRGYGWYEFLNPSEVFGDIMIDYSYVECTAASINALKSFFEAGYQHRRKEVERAIKLGGNFLKSIQRQDGSWYGSWGVCFSYGTWFGVEGLLAAGERIDSEPIQRAIKFLLGKQNKNGGWGESYVACVDKCYPLDGTGDQMGDEGSGVVQTAWALLAILAAAPKPDSDAAKYGSSEARAAAYRAAQFLRKKQLPSGDWEQEGITGVFNRSTGITYTAYRNVFPIWALGRYARVYGDT